MGLKETLTELLAPLIAGENYEFVDLHYRREKEGWVLRIFIDKPEGVTLGDCTKLSEKISRYLDEKNLIPQRYILEVSSPGLDRPLRKDSDFQKFSGSLAKINVFAPVNGQRHFLGRILGVEEKKVKLQLLGQGIVELPLENISDARLEVEI